MVNTVRWQVRLVLFCTLLVITACANNLITPSALPPSVPTSNPSIFFIQQEPVSSDGVNEWVPGEVRKKVYMTAKATGELMLVNGCLRLNATNSDTSYLLVWPPEFMLNIENDVIRILDGNAQVVARVGEEVYMSGGEKGAVELLDEHVREQLPPSCPGPYWIVGLEVRPNVRDFSDLVTVDLVSEGSGVFFLVRKKAVLDEWVVEEAPITGKLELFTRCPQIVSDYHPVNYTPVWPPDYEARVEGKQIEIVDGAGQVVARVGEEVRLSGGRIPVVWELEEYRRLREDLPGECIGPYWIVREQ